MFYYVYNVYDKNSNVSVFSSQTNQHFKKKLFSLIFCTKCKVVVSPNISSNESKEDTQIKKQQFKRTLDSFEKN